MKEGLAPILWPNSRILILGSLPGDESLRMQQYYANPRNQFWTILAGIYGEELHADYLRRLAFLEDRCIALWDVVQRADRTGSLDSSIRNATTNDFAQLLARVPDLRVIVFNGATAARLFERDVRNHLDAERMQSLQFLPLPSSSPIPGRNVLTLAQKIEKWRVIARC
jgi:hypoxanthine-DNA glycosylase